MDAPVQNLSLNFIQAAQPHSQLRSDARQFSEFLTGMPHPASDQVSPIRIKLDHHLVIILTLHHTETASQILIQAKLFRLHGPASKAGCAFSSIHPNVPAHGPPASSARPSQPRRFFADHQSPPANPVRNATASGYVSFMIGSAGDSWRGLRLDCGQAFQKIRLPTARQFIKQCATNDTKNRPLYDPFTTPLQFPRLEAWRRGPG